MGETGEKITDEAARALLAPRPQAMSRALVVALHMCGGAASGFVVAAFAAALAQAREPAQVLALALGFVLGACVGAAVDMALRLTAEPRRAGTVSWALAALAWVLAAAVPFVALQGLAVCAGAGASVLAASMHARCGLDCVRSGKRPLMRVAQWTAAMIGIVVGLALAGALVLTLPVASARVPIGLAALAPLVALGALRNLPDSARILLTRGRVEEAVASLIRSHRVSPAGAPQEVAQILIGLSLRAIAPRRPSRPANRRAVGFGRALGAGAGMTGTAGLAVAAPALLTQSGLTPLYAVVMTLSSYAFASLVLAAYSLPDSPLLAALLVNPEGATVKAGAVNLVALALAAALTPIGPLPVLACVAVSIVVSTTVVIPAGVAAIRRYVPAFSMMPVRTVLYGTQLVSMLVGAFAVAFHAPSWGLGILAAWQAVGLAVATIAWWRRRGPRLAWGADSISE